MADFYTDNDIQNAKNRVNQMRKKADYYIENDKTSHQSHKQQMPPQQQHQQKIPEQKRHSELPLLTQQGNNPLSFLKNFLGGDSDKMLILGLIILLSREGADQMLLLALLYIIL